MGAPLGNTNGRKDNREWANAIRRAVTQRQALGPLANQLVDKALQGDMAALRELGDRFDGKAAQQILGGDDEGAHVLKIIHESK